MGRGGTGEEGMIMVWEGIVIVVVRFTILDVVGALCCTLHGRGYWWLLVGEIVTILLADATSLALKTDEMCFRDEKIDEDKCTM